MRESSDSPVVEDGVYLSGFVQWGRAVEEWWSSDKVILGDGVGEVCADDGG